MYFFTSPTSTITTVPHPSPAYTSTAMSRTDSRDSTTSHTSYTSTYSTSPWDSHPQSHYASSTRPTSSSSMSAAFPQQHQPRRGSSASNTSTSAHYTWLPSPFRSCTSATATSEPSSYISDDDLLNLPPPAVHIPAATATSIPTSNITSTYRHQQQQDRELSTEEQMAILRAQRDRDDYLAAKERERRERAKTVRFEPELQRESQSADGPQAEYVEAQEYGCAEEFGHVGQLR